VAPGRVGVVDASGSGDDEIVHQVQALRQRGRDVTVVTADRQLRDRIGEHGAHVTGPRALTPLLG